MTREVPREDDLVLDPLPESRLHTFIDGPRAHALYFLEGQRLVRDLALGHALPGKGFPFLREAVLSIEPLVALLSGGAQFGFYLDAEQPAFAFKLEAHHSGDTRCAFLPHGFAEFPDCVTGLVRLELRRKGVSEPHQSYVRVEALPLPGIVDVVLAKSFQVATALHVSATSDQSLLLHRLPLLDGEDPASATVPAVVAELARQQGALTAVLDRALSEPDEIQEAFAGCGWRLIASRTVRFQCGCSRERLLGVLRLAQDPTQLLEPGADSLEACCEYCRTVHVITREELDAPPETVH